MTTKTTHNSALILTQNSFYESIELLVIVVKLVSLQVGYFVITKIPAFYR